MKLQNVKCGQIVKDPFGNRYKVLEIVIDEADVRPVKLRCTRHLGEHYYSTKSPSEETKYTFGIGNEWWIHKDESKDFSIVKPKLKVEDLKIGQIVVDKHGNEYEVHAIDRDDIMPIRLRCTKFVRKVNVQDGNVGFKDVDQAMWIYRSKKIAQNDGCDDKGIVTVKSIKLKDDE